jgi:hypothetical protein
MHPSAFLLAPQLPSTPHGPGGGSTPGSESSARQPGWLVRLHYWKPALMDSMKLTHLYEKFMVAVDLLATSPGSLQRRLEAASVSFFGVEQWQRSIPMYLPPFMGPYRGRRPSTFQGRKNFSWWRAGVELA